jgi:hypothetical protein
VTAADAARAAATERPRPAPFRGPSNYNMIYFQMAKSGCTTIDNIIYYLDNGRYLDDPLTIHSRYELWVDHRTEPARVASAFAFTFVRHPLRRAYSCFIEKVHATGSYAMPWVRRALVERYGARFPRDISLQRHRRNFRLFRRLAEDSLGDQPVVRRNGHWDVQAHRIRRIERVRALDFVGRIENLDRDLAAVLAAVGCRERLVPPRLNEGPAPPYSYEEVLTDEIVSAGEAIYRDDFRSFGYEH